MPFANRKLMMILLGILLLSITVSAETLTLEQCIELALKNHPNAVGARGNVRSANANLWNAFGNFLPSVSASGQVSQTEKSDHLTKNYSLGASANLTVFNGGSNFFDYFSAKANKAYFEYISVQTQQNLILSVKSYYFAYQASIKLKEIREEAVKRGEEQYKLANSKFEVGSASKSDVLKAKVQFGSDKLNLIDAENGIKKTKADLIYLIGTNVNSDIEFSPTFKPIQYDGTEADALTFGMSNYPGLLAADKNLSAAKSDVRSAWGRFWPTLSVSVGRNFQNGFWHEVSKFHKEDGSWSVVTTLNIPIFENFSRTSALSRVKASLNKARADYYYAQNSVTLEIKKAFLDMTRAAEKRLVAGENEEAAREDMSLVQEKYNLGAATILELLDAQVSLITAQNDKIQSEFDYNLAVAKLENAMGVR